MSILTQLREQSAVTTRKAYCEADQWAFDPRDTDGVCPICGWRPEEARPRVDTFLRAKMRVVPWDIVSLGVLVVVLVLLGVLVARATGS
jgi:hypothetical protein